MTRRRRAAPRRLAVAPNGAYTPRGCRRQRSKPTDQGARKKVIGIGIACLDQLFIWRDAKAPVHGNRIVDYDVQGGGMVATALAAVARLGGAAAYWGAVGTDWAADLIVDGLRLEGVDTGGVERVAGARGPVSLVSIDRSTGERRFPYSNGLPDPGALIGDLASLRDAGCLLVDGAFHPSAARAVAEARRLGVPVVGDIEHLREGTAELMAHVDYAIASGDGARELGAGEDHRRAAEAIRSMGARHVVITLGDRGLVYLDGDRLRRMPAFPVDVVDTTGAGDTFHGAFCYGLVEGMALERNLAFASAAAAMSCRHLGGRAGLPTRPEVEEFLRAQVSH